MSALIVSRIAGFLEQEFSSLIDMSDWNGRPDNNKSEAFLSRAVAAVCIKGLAKTNSQIAAQSVTDGFHDNGIDAIYFDQKTDNLIIVQSKWSGSGKNPIDLKGVNSFVMGIRDLVNARMEKFNNKIKAKEADIKAALYSDRQVKFTFVTAHTSIQETPAFLKARLEELVSEFNDPVEMSAYMDVGASGVFDIITAEHEPQKRQIQIALNDWGVIERPFLAYYGRIHVNDLSALWNQFGNSLFSSNLRVYYTNSDVNNAIRKTLEAAPEHFWYFNNGITLISDAISKMAVGTSSRKVGVFTCHNASIVNGAQTVGTIGSAGGIIQDATTGEGRDAFVQVRIISLEKCPPEFSRAITRAANLQNAVGNREFAAMDPQQHRLAKDFAIDRRVYVYKQGEADPSGDAGCGIVEATQALACVESIYLATLAKREISSLWEDTSAEPYTKLFNDRLSGARVWKCVQVLRAVESELHKLKTTSYWSAENIAVHLNRVILFLVFNNKTVKINIGDGGNGALMLSAARSETQRIFPLISAFLKQHHEGEYLGRFCKNFTKCQALADALMGVEAVNFQSGQGSLFGDGREG